MGERVAIVGSRNWKDHEMVRDYVYSLDEDDVVISGGAKGVDEWAEIYARERGMVVLVFRPDWNGQGNRAGLVRNHEIVRACDRVVAFRRASSRGTSYTIKIAHEVGKPVLVFDEPA